MDNAENYHKKMWSDVYSMYKHKGKITTVYLRWPETLHLNTFNS